MKDMTINPIKTPGQRGLGWRPDRYDERDYKFNPREVVNAAVLPKSVDLRAQLPMVYSQGDLGSCTANAIAAAFDFDRNKQGRSFINPSRLFIYYNEREMEGTTREDAGAMIRDGIKSIVKQGVVNELMWPYAIHNFKVKPNKACYKEALFNQALTYQRITQQVADMKACLASGYPFVAGIVVYEKFESDHTAKTGVIAMPTDDEEMLGGHAVLVVGYDDEKGHFICRNSWGTAWGEGGYFYLPYDYLKNKELASDMWVIKTVELGKEFKKNKLRFAAPKTMAINVIVTFVESAGATWATMGFATNKITLGAAVGAGISTAWNLIVAPFFRKNGWIE